ncbi:MAG: protein-methionine-sulfoxide reductase catalytic subunit MsrP [Rhodospirillaceae bacterium]|jgi:methionine sulfoxide reductase catalytic subunit|nr:protein-methionine-sulfoxide reductase catalytic subunit MsrP [Rhodospirillaceae bacterium]MBT5195133.1 protein-methionine-sulfoxide reductase catalytic subunit MsrP [Rhodospirillaceae bacterium]MBT5895096.1 protein-methionine-sulfoxide reductase catalytic subunit MsrP [Rhodospirillaceae bacterium]MBT6430324.1 protein-methionine-sulfoxide reductase catalytic subunit MsrP [Rhodospirillaceae bacterium]MBT7664629.1 protein-methionine-sulfoxide reductase catalytic subunit MsrP [Rhodospirillaceae
MLIKSPPSWQMPEREATPEHVFLNRRRFLGALGLGATSLIGGAALAAKEEDPTADLYPAMRNQNYQLDRPLTKERDAAAYNNFYEFGSHKRIAREARALKIRPWTVSFEGMVEKERQVDIDTLIRAMPLEERLYRMRCVEAWSMAVPWSGFPLAELVKYAKPLSGAKYLVMQTFLDKDMASGQKQVWYPWPYTEGLTMAEATNELAFMVTGVYGKPLAKQFGAPLRLIAPWKYGFKSVKSITRFEFTDKRPTTFWEQIQASEYGFWANVNPDVSHPRWSQASERVLGSNNRVPTLLYNGYGEQVAHMYKDLKGEKLFM